MSSKTRKNELENMNAEDMSWKDIAEITAISVAENEAKEGGMSDEAIAAANKQLDEELAYAKAFRYNPSPVAASVMYKTIEATGLSKQDIVTIALVCFQSATQENVQAAIAAIMGEKAQALFNSLK